MLLFCFCLEVFKFLVPFVVPHSMACSLTEPVSPALEGGSLTTGPLRKSLPVLIYHCHIPVSQIVLSSNIFLGNKCSVILPSALQLESESQGVLSFHLSSACVLCTCLTYLFPRWTSPPFLPTSSSLHYHGGISSFVWRVLFFIPKANVTLDCHNRSIFEILYLFWL